MLGMPDVETVDVLTINCNTIDTQISVKHISKKQDDGWCCAYKPQIAIVQLQFQTMKPMQVVIKIKQSLILLIIANKQRCEFESHLEPHFSWYS